MNTARNDRGLTVVLRTTEWNALVVGGGAVAMRKVQGLFGRVAEITVVAPQLSPDFTELAVQARTNGAYTKVFLQERPYRTDDLDGMRLVYVATGVREVAEQIHRDLQERHGVLTCFADFPDLGDFHVPAILETDEFTVTVSSGGTNPAGSAALRDVIRDALTKSAIAK